MYIYIKRTTKEKKTNEDLKYQQLFVPLIYTAPSYLRINYKYIFPFE